MTGKKPQSKRKREAERRAKKQQEARRNPAEVPIRISGPIVNRECPINLMVCNPSDGNLNQQVTAIIDTGCTRNAIREDIAVALNLPLIDNTIVHVVGGEKRLDVVLAKLVISTNQGAMSKMFEVSVVKEDELRDDMLLGMESLAGCVLTVDGIKGTWEWVLKNTRTARKTKGSK